MFPQRISRSEFRSDESFPDPSHTLEQHILAGFPPDLALDLVLNEIVVRAAEATRASAAALALVRGNDNDDDNDNDMVCRAATGHLAPGLGIPLKPRDGLSGACLQTREPQLCVDTERDPRVDSDISRRLGIRSILAVPVFETNNGFDTNHAKFAKFNGVLEVFSPSPATFSTLDQKLLEGFAEECARVRQAALELSKPVAAAASELVLPKLVPSDFTPPDFTVGRPLPVRPPYETWALVLGTLTIFAAIALSFLIGSRIGWLGSPTASTSHIEQPVAAQQSSASSAGPERSQPSSEISSPEKSSSKKTSDKVVEKPSRASSPASVATAGDLVVYDKGKLVFRLKSTPSNQINQGITEATSTAKLASTPAPSSPGVRLDPKQAEARLLSRTEPQYPAAALAAHQAGNVVLEVLIAEDGSVSHIRLLSGDPLLAAAATEAVRNWRYQPYLVHDHASQFQTDVTLTFALPN